MMLLRVQAQHLQEWAAFAAVGSSIRGIFRFKIHCIFKVCQYFSGIEMGFLIQAFNRSTTGFPLSSSNTKKRWRKTLQFKVGCVH